MECVTVLKNQEFQKTFQCNGHDLESQGQICRSRSHRMRGMYIAIVVLFVMVTILFALLLVLYEQLQSVEKKNDLTVAKVKDLLTAKEIENSKYWQRKTDRPHEYEVTGRRRRRNTYTPSFYVKGLDIDAHGVFLWNDDLRYAGDFAVMDSDYYENSIRKITVQRDGLYYLFARITLNGRNPQDGSSLNQAGFYGTQGVSIMKENSSHMTGLPLVSSYITQDQRGAEYGYNYGTGDYPMDTVFASGLFPLKRNDVIYVKLPLNLENNPNGEQYRYDNDHAQFGGFLV